MVLQSSLIKRKSIEGQTVGFQSAFHQLKGFVVNKHHQTIIWGHQHWHFRNKQETLNICAFIIQLRHQLWVVSQNGALSHQKYTTVRPFWEHNYKEAHS